MSSPRTTQHNQLRNDRERAKCCERRSHKQGTHNTPCNCNSIDDLFKSDEEVAKEYRESMRQYEDEYEAQEQKMLKGDPNATPGTGSVEVIPNIRTREPEKVYPDGTRYVRDPATNTYKKKSAADQAKDDESCAWKTTCRQDEVEREAQRIFQLCRNCEPKVTIEEARKSAAASLEKQRDHDARKESRARLLFD